jgi:hypothetical protein
VFELESASALYLIRVRFSVVLKTRLKNLIWIFSGPSALNSRPII